MTKSEAQARFRNAGSRHDCELPRSGQVMKGVSPGIPKAGFLLGEKHERIDSCNRNDVFP
jgi:hypothetical protein